MVHEYFAKADGVGYINIAVFAHLIIVIAVVCDESILLDTSKFCDCYTRSIFVSMTLLLRFNVCVLNLS